MTYDFRAQRLFLDMPLEAGAVVEPARAQAHYLMHVIRLKTGDAILVFNGRDGEWRASLREAGRKSCKLEIEAQTRAQPNAPDLDFLFATLKQARLDYMVQKGVEMGAGRLIPVKTQFTQIAKVNADRMRAKLRRHLSIKKQGRWLGRVVRGYLNYHAIPTNTRACQQFRQQVMRHWFKALRRRSQRDRTRWARIPARGPLALEGPRPASLADRQV